MRGALRAVVVAAVLAGGAGAAPDRATAFLAGAAERAVRALRHAAHAALRCFLESGTAVPKCWSFTGYRRQMSARPARTARDAPAISS